MQLNVAKSQNLGFVLETPFWPLFFFNHSGIKTGTNDARP